VTFLESAITTNGLDSDRLLRIEASQKARYERYLNASNTKKEEPEKLPEEQEKQTPRQLDDLSASMICRLRSAFEP
jgi:phage-related protein